MARNRTTFSPLDSRLFSPTFARELAIDEPLSIISNRQELSASTYSNDNDSNYRYDPFGTGLKSTQQLPVDFSRFENHTFFDSAESKVNIAFDRIINEFPFDGKIVDINKFLDKLTGFERWVFDQFPKNKGLLHFDASTGNYIACEDYAGGHFPSISTNNSGSSVLNPGAGPFAIEFFMFLPEETFSKSVVTQRLNSNDGYTLGFDDDSSTTTATLMFLISSGTNYATASANISKGIWNHVCVNFENQSGENIITFYSGTNILSSGSTNFRLDTIDYGTSQMFIGSGATHTLYFHTGTFTWTPTATLTGAMDDFRFYHKAKTKQEIKNSLNKNVFSDNDKLRLNYRFNEPTGSYTNNNMLLDHSGFSIHSKISNFATTQRTQRGLTFPLRAENKTYSPVLFPAYADLQNLNADLLASGSDYDSSNPNIITSLIPEHYMMDSALFDGFETITGSMGNDYGNHQNMPGQGKLPSAQLFAGLILIWAKFWDEIKLYIDNVSNLLNVDYDDYNVIPDQLLPFLVNYYGFEFPELFSNSTINQYVNGDDIFVDDKRLETTLSLQQIQAQIWKRILINLNHLLQTRGTIDSIKSLMRASGINPDTNFRFREYGGSTTLRLTENRQNRQETFTMLEFSGSAANVATTVNTIGEPLYKPYIKSVFLSASRIEPGIPDIKGTFSQVHYHDGKRVLASNEEDDGLLTSGSFTYEALYKFENKTSLATGSYDLPMTQSLMRFHGTGSFSQTMLTNLLLFREHATSSLGRLELFWRPTNDFKYYNRSHLVLTGVNIFDNDIWHVAVGYSRNDLKNNTSLTNNLDINQPISSSLFISVGKQINGELTDFSYKIQDVHSDSGLFAEINAGTNSKGAFICIGSQSITGHSLHLNGYEPAWPARYTDFNGKISNLRFWSKELTREELKEHARNYRSIGVQDPLTNFNFLNFKSGSYEKLRMHIETEQIVTQSDSSGDIMLFDFSQNNYHMSGSGFEVNKSVVIPEQISYSILDPRFDEGTVTNKVRIRSFLSDVNKENNDVSATTLYDIPDGEVPQDDNRFSIEVSLVQSLNEDIMNIIATYDFLNNAIGNPELMYSDEYVDLEKLRDVYFNRLDDKVNFKLLFNFFKWFDTSFNSIIERFIPRKTDYLGVNFVVESHMLERNKISYPQTNIFLDENNKFIRNDYQGFNSTGNDGAI